MMMMIIVIINNMFEGSHSKHVILYCKVYTEGTNTKIGKNEYTLSNRRSKI
jgi:hypothetical protein